jgi:hypothetical protein
VEGTLHLIEEDLAEHTWYVDLVADFVEDVQRFVMQQPELDQN